MTLRTLIACAVFLNIPAAVSAQSATFTWHWNRASDPITAPAPAALLPGESARVWLDIAWDAGSLANVHGLATILVDLIATDAQGTWVNSGNGFGGTQLSPSENFNFNEWGHRRDLVPTSASAWFMLGIAHWGTYQPATGSLWWIDAGQIGAPGATVSSANPVSEIWRGMYTPDSYAPRTIRFTGRSAPTTVPTGASLYTRAPGQTSFTSFTISHANTDFGTLNIPVIPAPSTLSLLGLCGILACRRRR